MDSSNAGSLADQLIRTIALHRDELDDIERKLGEHPIEVRFHYHPGVANIDMFARANFRVGGRGRRGNNAEDPPTTG